MYLRGDGMLRDLIMKLGKDADINRPPYPDEMHAVMLDGPQQGIRANFMGPKTHIKERIKRGDKPINDTDAVAFIHDKAYLKASELPTKEERIKAVHMADDEFIKNISKTRDAPLTASIAKKAIQLKEFSEKLGILDTAIFSGGSLYDDEIAKISYPDFMLKRERNMNTKGFHGGFFPLLIPILETLGPIALSFIAEKVVKKITGSGLNGNSKIQAIVENMDKLPQTTQIDIVHNALKTLGKNAFKIVE